MKRLTKRTDIAMAVNYNQYPIIRLDLGDTNEYGVNGTKVKFDSEDGKTVIRGYIKMYNDDKRLMFIANSVSLSAEIGYEDYTEMMDYANAPIVKANQEILVFMYNSKLREVYAPVILKTGDKIRRHCHEPLDLEEFVLKTR